MKEMVGGCCVCSDERGWDENPLVYCDGPSCNVAVHQACYGIVDVPQGPWFCRKCESIEKSGRVRCDLCPSRDGAFKKTDKGSWAHVVCALYIPEVRFENVSTMEPILISLIPQDRYNRPCYICEEKGGKESKMSMGACMQCNRTGCKQYFHVTCAQVQGLLCEEAGNVMDNVKYCGYCKYHYGKLKRTPNVKIIPPFTPIPSGSATDSPTSSPEKMFAKGISPSGTLPEIQSHMGHMDGILKCSKLIATKRSSGSGKASSVSSNSSTNSNSNSIPRIQIQPSNLFNSASGFSTLSNFNGTPPNGASVAVLNRTKSRSKSRSPSGDKDKTVKFYKHDEELLTKLVMDDKTILSNKPSTFEPNPATIIGDYGNYSTGVTIRTEGMTMSMKDMHPTVVLEKSKFDRMANSNPDNYNLNSPSGTVSTASRIQDKPPPEIVPHVTLTPIPMKAITGTDETGGNLVKSPGSTGNFTGGFTTNIESTDMATLEKTSAGSPGKRMRLSSPPRALNNSDTESATEDWPLSSNTDEFLASNFGQDTNPEEILGLGHPLTREVPKVTLERLPNTPGTTPTRGFPHHSSNDQHSYYNYAIRKANNQPPGGSSRDEDVRGKGPGGKRGRRGSLSNHNRREPVPPQVPSNGTPGVDEPVEEEAGIVGSGSRGGRHPAPPVARKPIAPPTSLPTPTITSSPSRRPNYEEPLTMSQLKAQMASSSASSTPEKNSSLAPHMFGNALNPASSMAQRMVDTLSQEMETIAAAGGTGNGPTESPTNPAPALVGIPFPGKIPPSALIPATNCKNVPAVSNGVPPTPPVTTPNCPPPPPPQPLAQSKPSQPQTLEELLERQWEQGSQFLMEQAQYLDISQLLSCLNQLKADNKALEDHVASLIHRKEQLTAINARLSIPLGSGNALGLPFQTSGTTSRQETPPLATPGINQGPPPGPTTTKNITAPAPHPQLHQHIQQEAANAAAVAAHQGRYASHKYQGYEPGSHPGYPTPQVHHRSGGSTGSGTSQAYYAGASSGQGSVNSHHGTSIHHQPRDGR